MRKLAGFDPLGNGGMFVRIFMGFCIDIDDTPEHARVPVSMEFSTDSTAPTLIHWREDAESNRARVLVAPPSTRQSRSIVPLVRPAMRRAPELILRRTATNEWSSEDPSDDIRGRMVDILV